MPIMYLDAETIQALVETQGLNGLCGSLTAVSSCMKMARAECGDEEEIPPEFDQAITLLSGTVNFICVEELASINADRQCMTSEALDNAVKENCATAGPTGEICNFSEDLECALAQYEEICDNRSLANKFRAFAAKLERDSNCGNRKARSATWRQLIKMLRR